MEINFSFPQNLLKISLFKKKKKKIIFLSQNKHYIFNGILMHFWDFLSSAPLFSLFFGSKKSKAQKIQDLLVFLNLHVLLICCFYLLADMGSSFFEFGIEI